MSQLTTKLSDRRWQRALAEADDVVFTVTHKMKRIAPVRSSAWLGIQSDQLTKPPDDERSTGEELARRSKPSVPVSLMPSP